jgi:hypothetical protein
LTDWGAAIEGRAGCFFAWLLLPLKMIGSLISASIWSSYCFLFWCWGVKSSSMSIFLFFRLSTTILSKAKSPLVMSSLKLLLRRFSCSSYSSSFGGDSGMGIWCYSCCILSVVSFSIVLCCYCGCGVCYCFSFDFFRNESISDICFIRRQARI